MNKILELWIEKNVNGELTTAQGVKLIKDNKFHLQGKTLDDDKKRQKEWYPKEEYNPNFLQEIMDSIETLKELEKPKTREITYLISWLKYYEKYEI